MIIDVCIVRDEEKKEREREERAINGKPVKAATNHGNTKTRDFTSLTITDSWQLPIWADRPLPTFIIAR